MKPSDEFLLMGMLLAGLAIGVTTGYGIGYLVRAEQVEPPVTKCVRWNVDGNQKQCILWGRRDVAL